MNETQTQAPEIESLPDRQNGGATALNRELSEQLGDDVRTQDPRWLRFSQQGVLVDLTLKRERFRLRLTLKDMGIEPQDKAEADRLNQIIDPGHLYLLPRRISQRGDSIDSEARESLKAHSYKTFWGFWVHVDRYGVWKAANAAIRERYSGKGGLNKKGEFEVSLVNQIEAEYDRLRADAIVAYRGHCQRSWDRLRMDDASRTIDGLDDKDAWVDKQLTTFAARIPTMEVIRDKLVYEYSVYSIPTMAQVEQDRTAAGQIRLTAAEQAMTDDLKDSMTERVAGGVDQFMAEIRGQLQSQVFDTITAALSAVRGNEGRIPRNSSVALQALVSSVRDMDFWGEGDLQSRLAELQAILDTPSKKRSAQDVERALVTLGAEARLTLLELDQPISREAAETAFTVGFSDDAEQLQGLVRRVAAPDVPELGELGELDAQAEIAVRRGVEILPDDFADLDDLVAAPRQPISGAA